jgi:hypothetical protein
MSLIGINHLKYAKLNKIALCIVTTLLASTVSAQELVQDGNFDTQALTEGAVTQSSNYWTFSAGSQL